MEFTVSPNLHRVPEPPIAEVRSWIAGRRFPEANPLIDLCQAIPDYPPAPALVGYLRELLDDPALSRYSSDEGFADVRESVASWYRRRYGAGPRAAELCLTVGASQAFWLAMTVLCRAGDEVIVPLPAYFDHPMALEALGVRCRWIPFDEESAGTIDRDRVARLVTPRTRALLLVSPANPTGKALRPAALQVLFELAREQGIALVVDETYNAFIPGDAAPHRLFSDSCWGDNLVHIGSFGKTFALTGYRAGALAGSEAFIRQALKIQDTMAVCQPCITQRALGFACEHLDGWVSEKNAAMQRRHSRFREEFDRPGNPFRLAASGGFFAWVRHPFGGTGRDAARRLAEEAHLLCLPGEAFGPGLEGYLRLAFGNVPEEVIPAAVQRLRQAGGG